MPLLKRFPTDKFSTAVKRGCNAKQGKGKQFLRKRQVKDLANHKHEAVKESVRSSFRKLKNTECLASKACRRDF